jgi:hypothetical protein
MPTDPKIDDPVAEAADNLDAARRTHQRARADHATAASVALRAQEGLKMAAAERLRILDAHAHDQGEATERALETARSRHQTAGDIADLKSADLRRALAEVHRRHLEELVAMAADHLARTDVARAAVAAAAADVDAAVASAAEKITEFQARLASLGVLNWEGNSANSSVVEQAGRENPELQKLHRSVWPRFASAPLAPRELEVSLRRPGSWGSAAVPVYNLGQEYAGLVPAASPQKAT